MTYFISDNVPRGSYARSQNLLVRPGVSIRYAAAAFEKGDRKTVGIPCI